MAATLKDIARETGLSVATISKYINGVTLREENRIAVERAIEKLDYTVNEYARGLKSNKSKTIGVVIPELSNLFITQIIAAMEDILRTRGYSVIICDCHTDEALECKAIRFLMSKRVDGIINMPVCRDGRHLKAAVQKRVPIVLIDRTIPALGDRADCVLVNNVSAAERAAGHLLENGHRGIGIIVGPAHVFTSDQRLQGYTNALAAQGLEVNPALILHSDYTLQGGYESMRALLLQGSGMTAVFVTNYEMTLGAMIAANEMGVNIPQDLSFIGFDNMDLSRMAHPKLTIVSQPLEEIGAQVAKILLERLTENAQKAPITVVLSTTMIEGNSVRKL